LFILFLTPLSSGLSDFNGFILISLEGSSTKPYFALFRVPPFEESILILSFALLIVFRKILDLAIC
jgi:hypothetical protein